MAPRPEYILNPITALEFYRAESASLFILAGEGSILKIFDAETSKLLCLCEVFDGQAIHGITAAANRSDKLQVAIWGGSSLTLLDKDSFDQLLAQEVSSIVSSATPVADWILDIAISPDGEGCVLITAHNTVLLARPCPKETGYAVETLASPSRSILYSADIIWESPSRILVAAGTVFGEIIVWQCSTSGRSQVLFTFLGHEGSIFGLDISDPVTQSSGTVGRLLASCSDDRTIRVWNLATTTLVPDSVASRALPIRETGFGEDSSSSTSQASDRCIATVMGHASRIWHVKFLLETDTSGTFATSVLSFGEDSTTQRWSLNLEGSLDVHVQGAKAMMRAKPLSTTAYTDGATKLSQLDTFAFHSGKSIWSTALCYHRGSEVLLVTGGADGKISKYNLSTKDTNSCHDILSSKIVGEERQIGSDMCSIDSSCSIDDVLPANEPTLPVVECAFTGVQPPPMPTGDRSRETNSSESKTTKLKKAKKAVKDGFNRYAFVSEKQVLATTNFGRVLLGNIESNIAWSEFILPDSVSQDLRSYTVVKGIPELGLVCLACANGKIYAYRQSPRLQFVADVEGKVADMFKVFNSATGSFELLVTTLTGHAATLFSVEKSDTTLQLSPKASCILPEKFIVTSAGRSNGFLILGARSGLLALYSTHSSEEAVNVWSPYNSSTADAITTVLHLPSSALAGNPASHFLTTDRTGSYSIFSCIPGSAEDGPKATVRCVHTGILPFGPLIEAAWFQGGDLFFCGFKSKSFIVWNESKQYEISNMDCGGAHRSYAYTPVGPVAGGHFVYTKASKLCFRSQPNPSHTITKPGGHGREIKASAVSSDGRLVATGAEDTAIRIWRYDGRSSRLDARLDCKAIVQGHTTGIQHLQWHGSNYLFSSGGAEEFFVWAVQSIPDFGIGVVREAECPDKSVDQDLRIMSFDVSGLPQSWSCCSDNSLLISLAYSDSTIRTYVYSQRAGFELLGLGRYKSTCLTQIRHLQIIDNRLCFLTAATDGNLTLWKSEVETRCSESSSPKPVRHAIVSSRKVHQNSVKSLDLVVKPKEIIVASGGDDNALGVSIYPIHALGDVTVRPSIFLLKSAQAAAITGLSILSHKCDLSNAGSFRVMSSGNDQRVKQWDIQLNRAERSNKSTEYELQISKTGDVFTSVADVGDLSVLRNDGSGRRRVLVVGNGIEIWCI
ncbi:uncharacterized protein L3040_005150 [Drepanopeziza brunnea f. sp. 'multigermtubi']|uniref:uncharacterized protein n=1 Tax=Drepanopeziza brunnea f. sp. 'multigermtubi' TaxID=698441 RepID=UPI00238A3692|nr:hypothetical protein L3040_005150 [Drepanopeziza brunnea f. sp. 'multigermtubi']